MNDDSLTMHPIPANMRTEAKDFSTFHTAEEPISANSGQIMRTDRGSAMRTATSHSVNAEIERNTVTVTPQSVIEPAVQAAPRPKRVMIDAQRGQVPSPAPLFTSPPSRGRGGGKAGTVPGRRAYSTDATANTVGLSPGRFPSLTPDPPEMQIDASDPSEEVGATGRSWSRDADHNTHDHTAATPLQKKAPVQGLS